MTIYDLQQRLQCGFWAMLPENLASFNASVDAVIKGDLPYEDPAPEEEEEPTAEASAQEGSTALVIPIHGTLMKAGGLDPLFCQMFGIADVDALYADISEAGADPSVQTLILDFDSPGGEVCGIPELANLIRTIAETKDVIGYSGGICASAAYWLASQCNEFHCAPSSLIGHVGVAYTRVDISKALAKEDIQIEFIGSSPRKFWGNPKFPMSAEEKTWKQGEVDRLAGVFKADVTANRAITPENLDAFVFDGATAVQNNFGESNINSLAELLGQVTKEG